MRMHAILEGLKTLEAGPLDRFYPMHYVVAILRNENDCEEATLALRAAGWSEEDILAVEAEKVLCLDTRGFLGRLVGLMELEDALARACERPSQKFRFRLLLAYAPDLRQTMRANQILSRSALFAQKYDVSGITELDVRGRESLSA